MLYCRIKYFSTGTTHIKVISKTRDIVFTLWIWTELKAFRFSVKETSFHSHPCQKWSKTVVVISLTLRRVTVYWCRQRGISWYSSRETWEIICNRRLGSWLEYIVYFTKYVFKFRTLLKENSLNPTHSERNYWRIIGYSLLSDRTYIQLISYM